MMNKIYAITVGENEWQSAKAQLNQMNMQFVQYAHAEWQDILVYVNQTGVVWMSVLAHDLPKFEVADLDAAEEQQFFRTGSHPKVVIPPEYTFVP